MNEIKKPNDILVSTLVNGRVETPDLISNGINADNTQLLDPEFYKSTKIVKKAFSDKDGNFNEAAFTEAYTQAAQQYQDLLNTRTYDNLTKYIEYNKNDIFAPLDSKKSKISYEITPERNPNRLSHGVSSLFDYGEQTQSMRELAQQSKIWDSENQVWLDKTAEDRGLLGSLFGESLVYATWDEDGVHEDPLTGRQILHSKGDWKLNDKGQYYTETIGNRSSRGKQFVVASDTLTKEGTALNKIDFFDSDDLEKSAVGTTFKAVAQIAPFLFPGSQMIWGGVTAALALNKALPAFAKMVEGIAVGGDAENETAFTRAMNKWENYFSKFQDSYSDQGNKSNWSYEKITNVVTDVFAQLYQMRAAASISQMMVKDPTRQALKRFEKEIMPSVIQGAVKPGSGISLTQKEIGEIAMRAAQKMPEVQEAIKAQSTLSKLLSRSYMALTSTADVYNEALNSGYDRRMAGFAGLAAAAGQYAAMSLANFDTWMLDKGVGYSEGANRATLIKALRPYYDDIKKAVDKLETSGSPEQKQKLVGGLINKISRGINKAWNSVAEEGQIYWKNAVTEALEEMTEEAVLDATKGVFDFMSWAGIGNPNASFGVAQDFTSGSFLERYIQSAFGGFVGGALFEFQQKKIEPFMKEKLRGVKSEPVQASLIHEIANGHTADLMKAIDEIAKIDGDVAPVSTEIGGSNYNTSANGGKTRGQVVGDVLKSYIQVLEGAIVDEGAELTDDQLLQKSIRDYQALKLLKAGGLDKMLVNDFTKLTSEIVDIKAALEDKKSKKEEKESKNKTEEKEVKPTDQEKKDVEEFDDGVYDNKTEGFLTALLEKKRKDLKEFLSGDKGEFYLYKTLVGSTPEIKTALGNLSIYDYTYLKYGKEWKDLPKNKGVLTKDKVKEEYDNWKKDTDVERRFVQFGVEAYADFDKRFSQYIQDYVSERYSNVDSIVHDKVLSRQNLFLEKRLDDNESYETLKKIADGLKSDQADSEDASAVGNVTLQDIFKQDVLKLEKVISNIVDTNPAFVKVLERVGKSKDDIINGLTTQAKVLLEQTAIDNLHGTALSSIFTRYFYESLEDVFQQVLTTLPEKNAGNLEQWLVHNGYKAAPTVMGEASANTDEQALRSLFMGAFSVYIPANAKMGLSTSVLEEYLQSEDTIDGEIALRIEEWAQQDVLNTIVKEVGKGISLFSYQSIEDMMNGGDLDYSFNISSSSVKELTDAINGQFGTAPLESIIKNWAQKAAVEPMANLENVPDADIISVKEGEWDLDTISEDKVAGYLSKKIIDLIKPLESYALYKQTSKKTIKQNPIFKSLKEIDLRLSGSGSSKVWDVLQRQHFKLRKAEHFSDYLAKGEEKVQLENALQAIDMYLALLVGMKGGTIGFGNPFAVNQQMARFLEKNKKTSTRTYETIEDDQAALIERDLKILQQQIKGYLQLTERAYSGKKEEDLRIKRQYSQLLLSHIQEKASAFTINDFSLLPSDDEVAKFKNPEDILLCYAHSIYTKLNDKFKTPQERSKAIEKIVKGLNLGKFDRTSTPSNLNRGDLKSINDYDAVLWLASVLGGDAYEFYFRYNSEFLADEKSQLIPLFSQEQAVWQAWAFARSEKNCVDASGKAITTHEAILRAITTDGDNYIPAANTFFVNGITGAGKSVAVSRVLARLCSDKVVYVSAANEGQRAKYLKAVGKGYSTPEQLQSGSVTELLGQFLTEDGLVKLKAHITAARQKTDKKDYISAFSEWLFVEKNNIMTLNTEELDKLLKSKVRTSTIPEIVLIDEATQVDPGLLKVLDYLAGKYNFKVILSGDTTQRGMIEFGDPTAIRDLFMFKSAKLNISVRALNNQKGHNNLEFSSHLQPYEDLAAVRKEAEFDLYLKDPNNHKEISYYQDKDTFNGDKFVENLQDAKEDIQHIAALNKKIKGKAIIITKLNSDNQPENPDLITMLHNNGFEPGDYTLYSYEDAHPKAVQGAESEYVIVDSSYLSKEQSLGELLRQVYTFASRSLRGSLVVLPVNKQRELGLSNRKDRFTQPDEIPQLADLDKIKEARKQSLEQHLSGYTPAQLELDKLNIIEVDGKKVAARKNAKPETKVATKKTTKKVTTEPDQEQETKLSEEAQEEIAVALNTPVAPIGAEMNTATTEATSKYPEKENPNRPTRVYAGFDHLGVPLYPGRVDMWDSRIPEDDPTFNTGLDMAGLFDTKRYISSTSRTGFLKFRYVLLTADSYDDVIDAIAEDDDITSFLVEILPTVADGLSLKTITADHRIRYAEWFKNHVSIDDNYYVFGKALNWKNDQPTTTRNANIKQSVGEGGTALYFGVRLKSDDDASHPLFNQYFSLGTMSDRVVRSTGEALQSPELQALYTKADIDIANSESKFVAYKLPKTKLYNLKLNSTIWIRAIEEAREEIWFESLAHMRRRGLQVDTENIHLVDSSTVKIKGKDEYAALVYAAIAGVRSQEINPKTKKPYSFTEKLESLKKSFVHNGELSISGSYMTVVRVGQPNPNNPEKQKFFERILFLSPKKNNIKDIFKSLAWTKENEKQYWVSRLSKCRPASQVEIIADLLRAGHAFGTNAHGYSNVSNLYKFLIGLRQKLTTGNASDKALLEELIEWVASVKSSNGTISREEFVDKIKSSKHKLRILLFPFYTTFIHSAETGYKIINIAETDITNTNGVDQLSKIANGFKTPISINLADISDGYSCPPFIGRETTTKEKILEPLKESEPSRFDDPDIPSDIVDHISFWKVPNYSTIGDDLGMYGYEVQAPTFSISNDELSVVGDAEEPLLRAADEARFVPRAVFNTSIPTKPEGFDLTVFVPEKLPEDSFIIDKAYQQYVVEEESVEWEYDKKKKKYKPKRVKDSKTGKWKIQKGKTKTFKGYKFKKDGKIPMWAKNSQGFEVRIGDVVQLWGDVSTSFRISGINKADPNDIKIRINGVGDAIGEAVETIGDVREVSIEAVTKVWKRTVAKKEHIKLDYYYKGDFDIKSKWETGKYAKVEKTAETMREMIQEADMNPNSVSSLNFEDYFYLLSPIEKLGGDNETAYLDTITGERHAYVVDSLESLINYHEQISDLEGLGYSLFRASRKRFSEGTNPADVAKVLQEKINEQYRTKNRRSEIVQHQVFFNEAQMDEVLGRYIEANPSTTYTHTYTAEQFTKADEILPFTDGVLDLDKLKKYQAGYIELPINVFANRSKGAYPENEFIVERIKDPSTGVVHKVRLYPATAFYFKQDSGTYAYTNETEDHDYRSFLKVIWGDSINLQDAAVKWGKQLKGLHVIDRQGYAYNRHNPTVKDTLQKLYPDDTAKQQKEINSAKLKLVPVSPSGISQHLNYTIIDIVPTAALEAMSPKTAKEKDRRHTLSVIMKINGMDQEAEGATIKVPMEQFLVEFGSRFILSDTGRSLEYVPAATSETVVPVSLDVETVTPSETTEDSGVEEGELEKLKKQADEIITILDDLENGDDVDSITLDFSQKDKIRQELFGDPPKDKLTLGRQMLRLDTLMSLMPDTKFKKSVLKYLATKVGAQDWGVLLGKGSSLSTEQKKAFLKQCQIQPDLESYIIEALNAEDNTEFYQCK